MRVSGLVFRECVTDAFARRLLEIAERLGVNADYLMACIAFESAMTFSPSVRNPVSGATGLIQFMPRTAEGLGTSTDELAQMTAVEQLDVVEQYFQPYAGRMRTLEDVYMAILWPAAVGKPNDYVIFDKEDGQAYRWNRGLDLNADGSVTKVEAAKHVRNVLAKGLDY